jgi:hypothetical protein
VPDLAALFGSGERGAIGAGEIGVVFPIGTNVDELRDLDDAVVIRIAPDEF